MFAIDSKPPQNKVLKVWYLITILKLPLPDGIRELNSRIKAIKFIMEKCQRRSQRSSRCTVHTITMWTGCARIIWKMRKIVTFKKCRVVLIWLCIRLHEQLIRTDIQTSTERVRARGRKNDEVPTSCAEQTGYATCVGSWPPDKNT